MEQEKSIFLEMFGDYPLNRVLDFLITYEDFDYPMIEIAEKSGVGYSTLKQFWPTLVQYKIVIQERKIGNAKLYKLNFNNSVVKKFRDFYWEVTFKRTHELLEKEGIHIGQKAHVPKSKKVFKSARK